MLGFSTNAIGGADSCFLIIKGSLSKAGMNREFLPLFYAFEANEEFSLFPTTSSPLFRLLAPLLAIREAVPPDFCSFCMYYSMLMLSDLKRRFAMMRLRGSCLRISRSSRALVSKYSLFCLSTSSMYLLSKELRSSSRMWRTPFRSVS